MAKIYRNIKEEVKGGLTPSHFGSHSSMINQEAERLINTYGTESYVSNYVVLTDEYGDYLTVRDRLDNGIADLNRYELFDVTGTTSITAANFVSRQEIADSFLKVLRLAEEEEMAQKALDSEE